MFFILKCKKNQKIIDSHQERAQGSAFQPTNIFPSAALLLSVIIRLLLELAQTHQQDYRHYLLQINEMLR